MATTPATESVTVEFPMELHIEGAGIVRYSAEGAKSNTKVLARIRRDVLKVPQGSSPKSIRLTLEFEIVKPEPELAEAKPKPKAKPKSKPKAKPKAKA